MSKEVWDNEERPRKAFFGLSNTHWFLLLEYGRSSSLWSGSLLPTSNAFASMENGEKVLRVSFGLAGGHSEWLAWRWVVITASVWKGQSAFASFCSSTGMVLFRIMSRYTIFLRIWWLSSDIANIRGSPTFPWQARKLEGNSVLPSPT